MRAICTVWVWACVLAGCASVAPPHDDFARGVALGFAVPGEDLERSLREVHGLGANEVSILVPLYTEGIHGVTVRRGALDDARGGDGELGAPVEVADEDRSALADAQLAAVIDRAHRHGLGVLVFPIVRLRVRRPGEWRGKLDPPDRDAFFAAYTQQLEAVVAVAQRQHAERLSVGSELVSFEADEARWLELVARLRTTFTGRLLYSANWDRYRDVSFWRALDDVGISAYFSLAPRGTSPSVRELVAAWQPIVDDLARFARDVQRPLLFTEVGFPSVRGAAFWPWNDHQQKSACAAGEGCEGELSVETQRRLWDAFEQVFAHAGSRVSFLRGVYAWLWAGTGGLRDRGYTPRGKPAESVLELWYGRDKPRPIPVHS